MDTRPTEQFIRGLQNAWMREHATQRIYRALADHEKNPSRRAVLLKLAENEAGHAKRWADRLAQLGAPVPEYKDTLRERVWRWILVQTGTDNALKRIESAEEDDVTLYTTLENAAVQPPQIAVPPRESVTVKGSPFWTIVTPESVQPPRNLLATPF